MKHGFKILWILTICGLWGVFGAFFSACEDKSIDSSIISKGSQMDAQAKEIAKNLDKESYKELADVFLDTGEIAFDKEVFIIFGKNQCKYCDMLKDAIKGDSAIKSAIRTHFNPYYVNISYDKIHDFGGTRINTENLAKIFKVNSTPILVFLDREKRVKYIYPGFSLELNAMVENVAANRVSGDYTDINQALETL